LTERVVIGPGENAASLSYARDLPPGSKRTLAKDELKGTHVAAMNVKRLQRDTVDPAVYRARLSTWEQRVARAGASDWRTFMDSTKLPDYLAEVR
jgi:hypothetical protein